MPKAIISRTCRVCGSHFFGRNAGWYCSDVCAERAIVERLEAKATRSDGCLLLPSYKNAKYAAIEVRGKTMKAHRLVWLVRRGPIAAGQQVCHSCDTPNCCNVEHMFLGTAKENSDDKLRKGRQVRGVRHHSARLNESDVRAIRSDARRHCVIAKIYNVTPESIMRIRQRKCWKHVE